MFGFSGRASCGPQTHTRAYAVVTMTPKRTQSIVDSFSSINARPRVLEDRILLQRTCHTYHMQMPSASSAFHGGVPLYTPNSNSRLGMRNAFWHMRSSVDKCGPRVCLNIPEQVDIIINSPSVYLCVAPILKLTTFHICCVCAHSRERGVCSITIPPVSIRMRPGRSAVTGLTILEIRHQTV